MLEVAMMMLFRDIPPIERSKIRLMSPPVSNDQDLPEDAKKADSQQINGPDSDGSHWRFRVSVGLFGAWLAYLAWVAWKVVVQ